MRLLNLKHFGSSEDEESDEEMSDESKVYHKEKQQDEENEDEDEEEESSAGSELSDEENAADAGYPYPTPPPDADVNMSMGNGVQKIKITKPKSKVAKATKSKTDLPEKVNAADKMVPAKKRSIMSHALIAITALNSRSGSSVRAIMKYMKSTGYEVNDERRLGMHLLRNLKAAVANGELVQKKLSFKLSPRAKVKHIAIEKMKAKKEKMLAKQKEKKVPAKEKKAEKEENTVKPKQHKKKANERKTKEPKRTKKNFKLAAIPGDAKASAGAQAKAALDNGEVASIKATSKSSVNWDPGNPSTSETSIKAKRVRKSIGTLTQPKEKRAKVQMQSIKRLVAGKAKVQDLDADEVTPSKTSTPILTVKGKRVPRMVK